MSATDTDEPLDFEALNARIRELHHAGLKVRDISSLLGAHPLVVLRVIVRQNSAPQGRA